MYLKTIAELLTTELSAFTTDKEFDIIVTDEFQKYTPQMTVNDKRYIPATLRVVTQLKSENEFRNVVTYQVSYRVLDKWRDDFNDVIKSFIESQSQSIIGDYFVNKITYNPVVGDETPVSGSKLITYNQTLIWTFAEAYTGRNVNFFIKGQDEEEYVVLPYLNQELIHDIAYVSNENENTSYRLTNDTLVMQIPLIFSNEKVLELYNSINSDTYNAVYDIKIVTGSIEVVKQVALKKGYINVAKTSGLIPMQLTFETHYPRVTIEIDGDKLPIVNYQYTIKRTVDQDNRYNSDDVVYSKLSNNIRSWNMTIIKNDTDAWNKLHADSIGNDVEIVYELNIDGTIYNVQLSEGVEAFTDTGDMSMECSFVEVYVDE